MAAEKALDLPAVLVDIGDGLGCEPKMVERATGLIPRG